MNRSAISLATAHAQILSPKPYHILSTHRDSERKTRPVAQPGGFLKLQWRTQTLPSISQPPQQISERPLNLRQCLGTVTPTKTNTFTVPAISKPMHKPSNAPLTLIPGKRPRIH
jgi:hypothetical protein